MMEGVSKIRTKLVFKRKMLGLSQQKVADGAGITRAYYASIETGRRNPTTKIWASLSQVLGITDEELGEMIRLDQDN